MRPADLHKTWRGWLNASFARQVTLFALSLTLAVFLVIGTGSYVALRAQIETAIQRDLGAEGNVVENHLRQSIIQAGDELETLSRNSFIANGLVDSQGRDGYLRPFLRDFRLSTPGKEDMSLTLHDFSGKPIIEVRPDNAIAPDADVVGQAIATGRPQVRIVRHRDQTYLKLVQPVHFPPTKSVEGALAVRIRLAPLLAATGASLTEGQYLQLHAADEVVAQIGASQQDFIRVERVLKFAAPFDTLRLRLTLDSSTRHVQGPLDRLTLIYAVGSLILLPLVGWLAHQGARRLVAPLVQLGATADAIATSGAITMPLQIEGPSEVGRLAGAFCRMLARLGAAQDELEQRVLDRTAELEAANQELEAFSYSVSHDLRTPLNTIDGFSNLLGKELDARASSDRGRHYLARIRAGVSQMGELIDALLSLAQVSRTSLRWDSVDLSAMAHAVVDGYREREPERRVSLDIQPGLLAQGDPRLLKQVLDNLLGNAWKFSGRQPQTRIAFMRETRRDGEQVYVVQDNGAGFDMAYADKLFGAFERLHSTSEFSGTGIGLATVHRIITRHGGRVWAESAPGQGACFHFTLGGPAG